MASITVLVLAPAVASAAAVARPQFRRAALVTALLIALPMIIVAVLQIIDHIDQDAPLLLQKCRT